MTVTGSHYLIVTSIEGPLHCWVQNCISSLQIRDLDLQLGQLTNCDTKCSSYEMNWNFLDPGKMLWLIWQR